MSGSARQGELPFRTWGGRRRGAGRPPRGAKAGVPHLPRPAHGAHKPVHVTWRAAPGVPALRGKHAFRAVRSALVAGRERLGGRIVQFSVQGNHIHLIVEARDRIALSRSLQGLAVRIARALNRAFRRVGKVFADRFHSRVLATPLEVKRALSYVLCNVHKHARERGGPLPAGWMDACSSAAWFDGWATPDAAARCIGARAGPRGASLDTDDCPVATARTWLLRRGWRRHGLLHPDAQ